MKDFISVRKAIIEATVARLQEKISNEELAVKEAQQAANEYGPPKDRYDGFRMQQLRKRDMLAEQMQKTIDDLETVRRIELKRENPAVSFGAMVITETQKLFISVALGKVIVSGESWQVISPSAPVSILLHELKKGAQFELMGKKIRILEVF